MPKIVEIENALVRMQDDVQRALQKPLAQRHWGMVVDLRKCVGCNACTVACKSENSTPPGVAYHVVLEEEIGRYPNVTRRFLPRPCMQCQHPPCVRVCPVNATYSRPDGVVAIDYDVCIGCRYCVSACPYGARYFDFGNFYTAGQTPEIAAYDTAPSFEYSKMHRRDPRNLHQSPIGNARKCHFCLHRVEKGILPACVAICIGGARYFGDLNDPRSLVAELVASPWVMRLKEELGTEPSVYYLL
ncbi:MAG TPA: 4Fe-4S dicluster domain-containing protein [Anaerolineae bacterium]|nr:4Fe-4S dicluster domain-containing protein [Anaerolineae bacterium]